MKTLVISEIFPPKTGGSGRWLWEIYKRLNSEKEYVVVTSEASKAEGFDRDSPIKIYRTGLSSTDWGILSIRGIIFYVRNFFRVRLIIKKEKIERIHCGRTLPEGVLAWLFNKMYGIPYACYVHGEDVEMARQSREFIFVVQKVITDAKLLICNSQNTKKLLVDNWKTELSQIVVMNPGVDIDLFFPAPRDIRIKEKLGWGERLVILTVSRLQERKGHDILIKALKSIAQEYPNVLYAIVGHGERKQELQTLVSELDLSNNVLFMANLSDEEMVLCYQQCDLFVLPNRTVGRDIEGFGMVLIEAQSCGKPVICGDSGGTVETLVDGVTGFVVNCDTPENLAELVIKTLADKDLVKDFGEKARAHVVKNFSWSRLAKCARRLFSSQC